MTSIRAPGIARAVVVLGHAIERYEAAFDWVQTARDGVVDVRGIAVSVVINEQPERGPFSSLQRGLSAVGGPAFVLPVDVPCADAPVLVALERALDDADAAVPRVEGRGGHPVLLAASAVARVLATPIDDENARLDRLLAHLRVARLAVDDPRVRMNLNTPSDWEDWQRMPRPPASW